MILLIDKADHLRYLESNLEALLYNVKSCVFSEDGQSHLKEGLTARHYILRDCKEYLERTCFSESKNPLSADVATEAALGLNAYYLNLRGAFDNIAWILQLEMDIIPGITENSGRRIDIHLFGRTFLSRLQVYIYREKFFVVY